MKIFRTPTKGESLITNIIVRASEEIEKSKESISYYECAIIEAKKTIEENFILINYLTELKNDLIKKVK